ncbi:hypothetical protein ACIA8I_14965 [Streptomyces rishiriensis]|uniref:hypothetical protein n=1 Tax=Streptomyces rishiriensis TaxID=68264 RepID=UPI00378C03CA
MRALGAGAVGAIDASERERVARPLIAVAEVPHSFDAHDLRRRFDGTPRRADLRPRVVSRAADRGAAHALRSGTVAFSTFLGGCLWATVLHGSVQRETCPAQRGSRPAPGPSRRRTGRRASPGALFDGVAAGTAGAARTGF